MSMAKTFTAAAIQTRAGQSIPENIEATSALIRQAAEAGASYVLTPEMTNILVRSRKDLFAAISDEAGDPALAAFRKLAAELGIWLHIGSMAMKAADGRAANRGFLIRPDGEVEARYDKIHLFDVDLPNGESWRESASYCPGGEAVVADLPWLKLGFTICYDLRFPALFRSLAEAGASMLVVPAAFTRQTGEAHWHVLLRARAIETGSYVMAAAQGGVHEDGRETYGHSVIIDPWGRVLAEAETDPAIVTATIDPAEAAAARARIPALVHARPFAPPVAHVPGLKAAS
jgi:predicted amidohydrolase